MPNPPTSGQPVVPSLLAIANELVGADRAGAGQRAVPNNRVASAVTPSSAICASRTSA